MDAIQYANVTALSPAELDALLQVHDGDSIDDIRHRVECALGLDRPMPMAALQRMMDDDEYFHDLIATRTAPAMLWHLLDSAGEEAAPAMPAAPAPDSGPDAARHSSAALLAKATQAFASWSKGGFTQVDETVRERRLNACLSCDQLSEPPTGLLYKVAGLMAADKRTCKSCGCFVTAKARLPHENCPLPAVGGSELSRWGEPLRSTA